MKQPPTSTPVDLAERERWLACGGRLRAMREERARREPAFSLRKVAGRCAVSPAYLSRVERGEVAPPGEETLRLLARDLGEDPDVLLALAGKVSKDLRLAIMKRPRLFGELIRQLNDLPDHAILRLVREVRDGEW